jgi:dynein heavy chain
MINSDGERLLFNKTVAVDGQVETWLLNVEDSMQKSLKTVMAKALSEYNRLPFESWIFAYPAQIVFTVVMVAWTRKVHLSLEKESPKDHLLQYEYYLKKRVESLAELLQKQKSALQSSTVRSLLLIDIHCVEVVRKLLSTRLEGLHDYEWTKQLRYFYDEKKHRCYVRQANSVLYYGYEFIGTTSRYIYCLMFGANRLRVVLTPQTERMQLAITEALQGHYGLHVIGPSGSGKTETIQNLARCLGMRMLLKNLI